MSRFGSHIPPCFVRSAAAVSVFWVRIDDIFGVKVNICRQLACETIGGERKRR